MESFHSSSGKTKQKEKRDFEYVNNQRFEFRKIYGKSTIDLKGNKENEENVNIPILILNLKSQQAWDEVNPLVDENATGDVDWTDKISQEIYRRA